MEDLSNMLLTTIDNPYNPHTQFDEWDAYDRSKGYCTLSYLARICTQSDSLTEKENDENYNNAMLDILNYDPIGIYRLIGEKDTPKPVKIGIDGGFA